MKTSYIALLSAIAQTSVTWDIHIAGSLAIAQSDQSDAFSAARQKAVTSYKQLKSSHPYVAQYLEAIEQVGTNYPGAGSLMPAFVKGNLSTTCSVAYISGVSVQMREDPHGGTPGLLPQTVFSNTACLILIDITQTSGPSPDIMRIPDTSTTRAYRKGDLGMKLMIHPRTDPQIAAALIAIADRLAWEQTKTPMNGNDHSNDK